MNVPPVACETCTKTSKSAAVCVRSICASSTMTIPASSNTVPSNVLRASHRYVPAGMRPKSAAYPRVAGSMVRVKTWPASSVSFNSMVASRMGVQAASNACPENCMRWSAPMRFSV